MKTFFPDLPLNSGFYRVLRDHRAGRHRSSSAKWPVAVTGFLMPFEKIMNAIYEIWSKIMPQRAHRLRLQPRISADRRARCAPTGQADLHVLRLAAGRLGRAQRQGRLQRHHGLLRHRADVAAGRRSGARQPDPDHRISKSSRTPPGPANGAAAPACARRRSCCEAEKTVISYICDRERAVVWGIEGGLPSMPHGLQHYDAPVRQ